MRTLLPLLLVALLLLACAQAPAVEPAPQGLPTRALPGGTSGTTQPFEDAGVRRALPPARN